MTKIVARGFRRARWAGSGARICPLPEQLRHGLPDTALEGNERRVTFGVRCTLSDEAHSRGDETADEHQVVVQRICQAVRIFVLTAEAPAPGTALQRD